MTERARHHASGSAMMRIYQEWDDALGTKDAATAATLYHPDATLESPLVSHLLGTEEGIVRGRAAIEDFAGNHVFPHQPPQRRRFRGALLGLIAAHRVYWGWLGVGMLLRDEHGR
jgi:hypothetical protein